MVSKTKSKIKGDAAQTYSLPPQNIEAEKCVLGAILLESRSILKIIEKLQPDDYYLEAHRIIYKVMVELFNRSQPQDIIAVTNALRDVNQLENVGGPAYVASLTDMFPVPSNTSHYVDIIVEKSILRQ